MKAVKVGGPWHVQRGITVDLCDIWVNKNLTYSNEFDFDSIASPNTWPQPQWLLKLHILWRSSGSLLTTVFFFKKKSNKPFEYSDNNPPPPSPMWVIIEYCVAGPRAEFDSTKQNKKTGHNERFSNERAMPSMVFFQCRLPQLKFNIFPGSWESFHHFDRRESFTYYYSIL